MAHIKAGQYTIIDDLINQKFADNVWIGNFVHIRPNVTIGENSEIRDYCFIAPDVVIGKNTRVYQKCNIGMGTVIGDNCFLGVGTYTMNDKELHWPDQSNFVPNPPIIEDNVRIGMGVKILPGIRVRKGSRIGAGAVVTHDTEEGKTYVGIPARELQVFELWENPGFKRIA